MVTYTNNLRLNVPEFDQSPWDFEVNTNWDILDATVGMFTAIPNLAGVWVNSKAYLVGQSVIDAVDSSIWYCLQGHTTPPPPTLFAADRILNPARWTQTSGGAQFYAQQAADAAAQAIDAANDAQAAVDLIPEMLPLDGGIMTGALILFGDPTDVLGAASKQYVDARVGGTGFLPLSGGTLTGILYAGGTGIGYMGIGAANRKIFQFGSDGVPYMNVDGVFAGHIATSEFINTNYLPLSGGTVAGNLHVNGDLSGTSSLTLTASNTRLLTGPTYTELWFDNANSRLRFTRATNTFDFVRGYDAVVLVEFGGDGTNVMAGTLKVNSGIESGGPTYSRGSFFLGNAERTKWVTDNSTYTILQMLDNYQWRLDWGTGNMHWQIAGFNFLSMRFSDNKLGNSIGPVFGTGAYEIASDERLKTAIQPARYGLPEIMGLNPIRFTRTTGTKREEEGFSAQQVQQIMPTAVSDIGDDTPILAITLDPIVVALVNGMKELATRMNALENRT